jgi:hypothetical protein
MHDLKNQVDKLRAETGTRSEELRERAKNLTKVKSLADERHGEIERLWGERRQLIDDCRTERTKFQKLEVEKKLQRES